MGGSALKKYGVRRYLKDEFNNLSDELIPKIVELFKTDVELVKSYNNKESFGDMDLLVLNTGSSHFLYPSDLIIENLKPKGISKNSNVISFEYKELQIDLILTKSNNWETSKVFFAYNDLGNLMGRIYNSLGFKWGFDGLKYVHKIDDKVLGEIMVSKNPRDIFQFIGLDYDRFLSGFDNLSDVFDFLISSPFFNPDKFKVDNMNVIDSRKFSRRNSFNLFVEYINSKIFPDLILKIDKNDILKEANYYFSDSNLLEGIESLKSLESKKRLLNSKFNGRIIMDRYPHISGKLLGEYINKFKSIKDEEFFLNNSIDDIMEEFEKIKL